MGEHVNLDVKHFGRRLAYMYEKTMKLLQASALYLKNSWTMELNSRVKFVTYEICPSLNSHFSQDCVYKHKTIPEVYDNSVNYLNVSRTETESASLLLDEILLDAESSTRRSFFYAGLITT